MPVMTNPNTFRFTPAMAAEARELKRLAEPQRILRGCKLVTAEIFYRLPDHPLLLTSYIVQELDHPERLPLLMAFLQFWRTSLDGKMVGVEWTLGEAESNLRIASFYGKLGSGKLRRRTM